MAQRGALRRALMPEARRCMALWRYGACAMRNALCGGRRPERREVCRTRSTGGILLADEGSVAGAWASPSDGTAKQSTPWNGGTRERSRLSREKCAHRLNWTAHFSPMSTFGGVAPRAGGTAPGGRAVACSLRQKCGRTVAGRGAPAHPPNNEGRNSSLQTGLDWRRGRASVSMEA
jgi:hypothetical protein